MVWAAAPHVLLYYGAVSFFRVMLEMEKTLRYVGHEFLGSMLYFLVLIS